MYVIVLLFSTSQEMKGTSLIHPVETTGIGKGFSKGSCKKNRLPRHSSEEVRCIRKCLWVECLCDRGHRTLGVSIPLFIPPLIVSTIP